jgi:hypothetical protein
MALSKKQRKILDQIFEQPVRSDVVWTDIESLLEALGAEISEGRGSRVRVAGSSRLCVISLTYIGSIFVSFVSLWFVPPPRQQDCILEYILPTKPKRAGSP